MKAVVQRVLNAGVTVDGIVKGSIKHGLLIYLGIAHDDVKSDADRLAEKIVNLRIFDDTAGKMNLSLMDITAGKQAENGVGVLAVSQFTLLADARKGRRPSWNGAAPPEKAKRLYEYFMDKIRKLGLTCESGVFQASMKVSYTNDGPVTIILDTKELQALPSRSCGPD
ncbi:MAG: D-tyrosyl-tRNA(Tyr) deacylase [Treponema sp.]|jgi:D-tyrosyl-tRNA(Tyr) deacylase|nr:D-tyrosyl-tRNA(Tyr) deacylase [Treponema sp.]